MDKEFREKLEGFTAEPPAHLWDGIQGRLAAGYRARRWTYYRWAAVAALLVLAFAGGWYFNESSNLELRENAETKPMQTREFVPENRGEESFFAEKPAPPDEIESIQQLPEISPGNSVLNIENEVSTAGEINKPHSLFVTTRNVMVQKIDNLDVTLQKDINSTSLAEKKGSGRMVDLLHREGSRVEENISRNNKLLKEARGWKLGFNISPGYSSYSANHGTDYLRNMTYAESEGNGNLSGGISFQYKTGKRWSVESGVYYAQNGQQAGSSPHIFGNRAAADNVYGSTQKLYFNTMVGMAADRMAMNSTAGIIEFENFPQGAEIAANLESTAAYSNSLITDGELSQVFDFVEIPFLLRFLLIDSTIDVELAGGLNAGLVVGNNAFIDNEYGSQKIGKTRDISTINFSGSMGVGVTYRLSEHFSLSVEPRLNYYLNSINRNPDVDFRPYRVGVYSGLYYEF